MILQDTTWVITGASAGIGAAIAQAAAENGAKRLFLIARRLSVLQNLETELKHQFPELITTCMKVDLLIPEQRTQCVLDIYSYGEVDIWVNNAGMGGNGCFDNLDTSTVLEIIRLNIEALSDFSSLVIKRMKSRKSGAVLQVGSVAGLMPLPTMGLYAATKAFVLSLTDSLNGELAGTGVSVHCLNPAPVKTEFLDVANRKGSLYRKQIFIAQNSRAVAKSAIRGLRLNLIHIYPWLAWPFPFLAWLVPRFLWRFMGKPVSYLSRRQNT